MIQSTAGQMSQSIFHSQLFWGWCFQSNYPFFNKLPIPPGRAQFFHPKSITLIRIPSAIADPFAPCFYVFCSSATAPDLPHKKNGEPEGSPLVVKLNG
jgi:hypothetical protein